MSPPERVVTGGIGTVSDGGSVLDGHFDDAVEAERAYLAGMVAMGDEVEVGDDDEGLWLSPGTQIQVLLVPDAQLAREKDVLVGGQEGVPLPRVVQGFPAQGVELRGLPIEADPQPQRKGWVL